MKLILLMKKYLDEIRFAVKDRTFIGYNGIANLYVNTKLCDIDLKRLSNEKLNKIFKNRFCEEETLSIATIKLIKNQINRCLSFGREKKLIPLLKIDIPLKMPNKKIQCLRDDKILKIENYLINNKKVYSFGILISLLTGLRIGELLSLKWQDVDFEKNILNIRSTASDIVFEHKLLHLENEPKTESSIRQIPITKELKFLLNSLKSFQKNKSKYVVSRENGKRIQIRSYQESWNRLLKKLDIKHYGFHSLRHTFATRCNRFGMDIKTLSELLGHSNPSITLKTYVHSNLDMKREALLKVNKKIRHNLPD